MSEAAKLQLNGISSGYGAVDVINDVSLAIKQGRFSP